MVEPSTDYKTRNCKDFRVFETWSTPRMRARKLILLDGIIVVTNLKLISQTENEFKSSGNNLLFYRTQFLISHYKNKSIIDKQKKIIPFNIVLLFF